MLCTTHLPVFLPEVSMCKTFDCFTGWFDRNCDAVFASFWNSPMYCICEELNAKNFPNVRKRSQSGGVKLIQACSWKHFSYVVNFWLQFVPGCSKWMFWLLVTGTKAHIWECNDLSTNSLGYYRAIEKDPLLMKNKQRFLCCFRWICDLIYIV